MTTLPLYELANMRDVLDTWLLESEGDVTPELEALLSELDEQAETKIERVALFIREQTSLAEAATRERDRLAGIAATRTKAAASLTHYLHRQMVALGKEKVNGVLVTVALQKNPPRVNGDLGADAMADIYHNNGPAIVTYIPESYVLDRKAVLAAHKAGQPLPIGLTVEQSISLRIR